ncbi:SLAM family member 5-like isoform X2 [Ctenopharyngodon idella]|uniref:SLAM family member 5-like isoform X2 n=1 Tax=Ctenopharyngodon idella TaxID=7959 RepID=UPI0022323CBD|nr:SLAM family member 5-like isoform X2 [Ctenopharyngodon idella]
MKKMFLKLLLICLCLCRLVAMETVSVTQGDTVTLNSGLTEMKDDDEIQWMFGNTLIAEINKQVNSFTVHDDVLDGRFRDSLKLDKQTGSLTITAQNTGVLHLWINQLLKKTFHLFVHAKAVFLSVTEGDSFTLNPGLTEIFDGDEIQWKFGIEETLIAEVNKRANSFTVYDDVLDGRFRDRLKLDKQTGSLTITNTTMKHDGLYEVKRTGARFLFKLISFSVYARLPVPVISSNSSQCSSSSSSCSLVCSAVNVEYQDKNTYSCVLNNPISNQTQHLDITQLCHTCSDSVKL